MGDAVVFALHSALTWTNTYTCMLFLEYSSAFNTVHPTKLVAKLADLGLPTPTCYWI